MQIWKVKTWLKLIRNYCSNLVRKDFHLWKPFWLRIMSGLLFLSLLFDVVYSRTSSRYVPAALGCLLLTVSISTATNIGLAFIAKFRNRNFSANIPKWYHRCNFLMSQKNWIPYFEVDQSALKNMRAKPLQNHCLYKYEGQFITPRSVVRKL